MATASSITSSDEDDIYTVPFLARLLHSLPHLNITLHQINNSFEPKSPLYLESLGILGSIPAIWLILTLFIILIYFLTRCCDRKPRPARSIAAFKVCLAIVAVICCAALGLGLYGNDDVHNGVVQLLREARQIDTIIVRIRNQTHTIEQQLRNPIGVQLNRLSDIFDGSVANFTLYNMSQAHLKLVTDGNRVAAGDATDIRQTLIGLNLVPLIEFSEEIETYRWPFTIALLSVLLVLCVVLLVGVVRHSRCALIAFSVCGLLAIIASYALAGVYIVASVALGDLCVAPDRYVEQQAATELLREILRYYTGCERARANPFAQRLREASSAVSKMRSSLQKLNETAPQLYSNNSLELEGIFRVLNEDVNSVVGVLNTLTAAMDCRVIHAHYVRAAKSLCHSGLFGLTIMMLSALLAGFLLTALVWVDSHTWIYIRKKKEYQQVNDTDHHHNNHAPYTPSPHQSSHHHHQQQQQQQQQHQQYQHHQSMGAAPLRASAAAAAALQQRSQGLAPLSNHPPDTPPPSYTSALMHSSNRRPHATAPVPHEAQSLLDGCDMMLRPQHTDQYHYNHLQQQQQRNFGHHLRGQTLGRLPSHHHHQYQPHHHHNATASNIGGANNGKFATLSKQCKTLESSDFY